MTASCIALKAAALSLRHGPRTPTPGAQATRKAGPTQRNRVTGVSHIVRATTGQFTAMWNAATAAATALILAGKITTNIRVAVSIAAATSIIGGRPALTGKIKKENAW